MQIFFTQPRLTFRPRCFDSYLPIWINNLNPWPKVIYVTIPYTRLFFHDVLFRDRIVSAISIYRLGSKSNFKPLQALLFVQIYFLFSTTRDLIRRSSITHTQLLPPKANPVTMHLLSSCQTNSNWNWYLKNSTLTTATAAAAAGLLPIFLFVLSVCLSACLLHACQLVPVLTVTIIRAHSAKRIDLFYPLLSSERIISKAPCWDLWFFVKYYP